MIPFPSRSRRADKRLAARPEFLECRRLLSALVGIDATSGALTFTEQTAGINNTLEVSSVPGRTTFFDDPSDTMGWVRQVV